MGQTGSAQREPSMEEILASIRRIIEDSDSARKQPDSEVAVPELSESEQIDAFREEIAAPDEELQVSPEAVAAEPAFETEQAARITRFPVRERDDAASQEPFLAPGRPDAVTHFAPADAAPAEQDEPFEPASIISERAGRQVAASFGELSEAFAASRRRNFDDMAREMLRPMLQEWLDDNLPGLVERLVREEIERVARGVS